MRQPRKNRHRKPVTGKEKAPTEADGGNFRKRVDNARKMWYDKSTREHRRRLLPSTMVKDNRSALEAEGGYLFLCCAMYSNRRFRAKTIATNPSCRFMSITSFLSEGEKTCSLRKNGRSNRHRQATPVSQNAARVCRHTSDTTKQNAVSLLGVPKSAEKSLRLFYYTAKGAVCQVIRARCA